MSGEIFQVCVTFYGNVQARKIRLKQKTLENISVGRMIAQEAYVRKLFNDSNFVILFFFFSKAAKNVFRAHSDYSKNES